jgi:hypothetical protein
VQEASGRRKEEEVQEEGEVVTHGRKLLLSLLGSCAALAIAAPAAQAALTWNADTYDFGSANVGTAAAPKEFVLTATCDIGIPLCLVPLGGSHPFGAPAVTGAGFALVEPNTCASGALSTPTQIDTAACTTTVTFTPTAAGATTGALNLPTGPDIALSGTGAAPAPGTTKKKKCKKKKKTAAAAKKKKCKKKRK